MKNNKVVSASEVGEYVYCKRAWWLKFSGLIDTSESMIKGAEAHEALAYQQYYYKKFGKIFWLLFFISVSLLLLILFFLYL